MLIITFLIIPIVLTFVLAFTNARLISPQPATFIGFDNFIRLFADDTFWAVAAQHRSLRRRRRAGAVGDRAAAWRCWSTSRCAAVNFFRTIYFLPVVTSIVVVSILWLFMYQPDGLINAAAGQGRHPGTGLAGQPEHRAVRDHRVCRSGRPVGFHMVIWLSGLQTIPGELYEAAAIDGATNWQQFRYVTWPGLRQTRPSS